MNRSQILFSTVSVSKIAFLVRKGFTFKIQRLSDKRPIEKRTRTDRDTVTRIGRTADGQEIAEE